MVSSTSRRMMLTVLSQILARSGRETVEQTTNGILKTFVGAIGRMNSRSMESGAELASETIPHFSKSESQETASSEV